MKTKYNWSNVPKEVQWIATDRDKVQVEFTCKPTICQQSGMWIDKTLNGYYGYTHDSKLSDFQGSWQESLEERPK